MQYGIIRMANVIRDDLAKETGDYICPYAVCVLLWCVNYAQTAVDGKFKSSHIDLIEWE